VRAPASPGNCVCLCEHVSARAFACFYAHPTFLGMRETLQRLVTVRQEAADKSNRPEFKKGERADFLICRGSTRSQKILKENSCVTSLTFISVNAVSEDQAI